jgi:16S rRNA (guanine(966)-N(2))-methyltransferase RsmD
MRIVTGSAKGARLAPVPDGVRPLSDRAREGLFSSLGPDVVAEAIVLDLFAGTGAVGIEALSRGATRATFVERSAQAGATIHRNLDITGLAADAVVQTLDVARFLERAERPGAPFDLVFCDPPYDMGGSEVQPLLEALTSGWVADQGGTIVLTRGERSSMPVIPVHWAVARELRYGDSLVLVIRPQVPAGSQPEALPENA